MSGAFIVFEGIDGAGKTTVSGMVAKRLLSDGFKPIQTAEPSGGFVGKIIREGRPDVSQLTEAYLFCADRADHTEKVSGLAADGWVVLCDRYFASTIAYQSASLNGDSEDVGWLIDLSKPFTGKPDATILLDIDPTVAMERAKSRGEPLSKFENTRYLEQVRRNYLDLADRFGFSVVDASRPVEEVAEEVYKIVRSVL